MRLLLVAPGDLVPLVGIAGVLIGLGMAGDQVADWVHERQLPSDPIARHLITSAPPRCARGKPLPPRAMPLLFPAYRFFRGHTR